MCQLKPFNLEVVQFDEAAEEQPAVPLALPVGQVLGEARFPGVGFRLRVEAEGVVDQQDVEVASSTAKAHEDIKAGSIGSELAPVAHVAKKRVALFRSPCAAGRRDEHGFVE